MKQLKSLCTGLSSSPYAATAAVPILRVRKTRRSLLRPVAPLPDRGHSRSVDFEVEGVDLFLTNGFNTRVEFQEVFEVEGPVCEVEGVVGNVES